MKTSLSLSDIETIKRELAQILPNVKSSHRVEAMARGLGWNTHAASLAELTKGDAKLAADDRIFREYLHGRGFPDVRYGALGEAVVRCKFADARAAIQRVLEGEPALATWGFGMIRKPDQTRGEREAQFHQSREEMLTFCRVCEFIRARDFLSRFGRRVSVNKDVSSYGLKHRAEEFYSQSGESDNYIGNGLLIAAAIHLGFTVMPTGINACLNISSKKPDATGEPGDPNRIVEDGAVSRVKRKRQMNQSESWAQEYLTHQGFTDIVFEPEGNVPPDFLVNGKIAIEVRRLNQHHESESGEMLPLEELAIPLHRDLEALLESFGPPENGVSWYVSYRFKRPQLTKNWKKIVRAKLQPFLSAAVPDTDGIVEIDRNFRLRLTRRREPGRFCFIMGGHSDFDSGGWVIPELEKNLTLCIEEKTRKIAGVRSHYSEWWLVLVDFIGAGEREPVRIRHDWDKVLVIHPRDYSAAYEVKTTG